MLVAYCQNNGIVQMTLRTKGDPSVESSPDPITADKLEKLIDEARMNRHNK